MAIWKIVTELFTLSLPIAFISSSIAFAISHGMFPDRAIAGGAIVTIRALSTSALLRLAACRISSYLSFNYLSAADVGDAISGAGITEIAQFQAFIHSSHSATQQMRT